MEELRRRARNLRNNATDAERHLWQWLRAQRLEGYKFRRQVPVGGYIADFMCPQLKLIIEIDGGRHADQVAYDSIRTHALETLGFQVLRYWNDDVLLRTDAVLDDILRYVESTPPQPSPSLREREGAETAAETTAGPTANMTADMTANMTAEAAGFAPSLSPQAKGRVGEGCS